MMQFIVDAQLPKSLCSLLISRGHDAIHTLDLPEKNKTSDQSIIRMASLEGRIVVTKDSDFIHYRVLKGQPARILLVTTGNIKNSSLMALFTANFDRIMALYDEGKEVIEMDADHITVHL